MNKSSNYFITQISYRNRKIISKLIELLKSHAILSQLFNKLLKFPIKSFK